MPVVARLETLIGRFFIALLVGCLLGMAITGQFELAIGMFGGTLVFISVQSLLCLIRRRKAVSPPLDMVPKSGIDLRIISKRPIGPVLLVAAAAILMILSAFWFQPTPWPNTVIVYATLAMLVGGLVLLVAIYWAAKSKLIVMGRFQTYAGRRLWSADRKPLIGIGVLLLLIEAEISGKGLKIPQLVAVSPTIQGMLFWGGVLLVTVGMTGGVGWQWAKTIAHKARQRDRNLWAILGICGLAFALRAWNLGGTLPTSIDDGVNWVSVYTLLTGDPYVGLVASANPYQLTPLYAQLQALAVNIFGPNMAGIRAVNVPFGVLHVLALYLLIETLFDTNLALIAALFLATFPPHIHFSRLSFLHILDATFGAFALAFMARGLKYHRRVDWALAGIALGLTQYWFEAGRLFFGPLILIWAGTLILFDPKRGRILRQGLALMAVGAFLIAIPAWYATIQNHSRFAARLGDSGSSIAYWQYLFQSSSWDTILIRLAQPLLVYVQLPETPVLFYGGYHPLVLEILVPFFLLGAFYLMRWWRTPANILLLWLLATSAGGLLMQTSTMYPRFIVGFPAIAALIACGVYLVSRLLFSPLRNPRLQNRATALLVGAICLSQVIFYFYIQVPELLRQLYTNATTPDVFDAAARTVDMPSNTDLILISNQLADENVLKTGLALFRWGKPRPNLAYRMVSPNQVTLAFLKTLPTDRDLAFFIEPGHAEVEALIHAVFKVDEPQLPLYPIDPPSRGFVLLYASLKNQK